MLNSITKNGLYSQINDIEQAQREETCKKYEITPQEYDMLMKKNAKIFDVTIIAILSGFALTSAGIITALITGKFPKPLNWLSNKISTYINNKVQENISQNMNFDKLEQHFRNGIIKDGKVSGAHELRGLISVLKDKGTIHSITESKTKNGVFEFAYSIGDSKHSEVKTFLITEVLKPEDIKDIINLCDKADKQTLEMLSKLQDPKNIVNFDNIMKNIEKAIRNGQIIKNQKTINEQVNLFESKINKCKAEIKTLEEKLKTAAEQLKKANEKKNKFISSNTKIKELDNKINAIKAKIKSLTSAEQEQLKKELVIFKEEKKKIIDNYISKEITPLNNSKINLESKLNSEKANLINYETKKVNAKNSFNIFGNSDGKLYAAYAHDTADGEIIIDSAFPIKHGSRFQDEYLNNIKDGCNLPINNISYLIGAQQKRIINCLSNIFKNNKGKLYEYSVRFSKKLLIGEIILNAGLFHYEASRIKKNKKKSIKAVA